LASIGSRLVEAGGLGIESGQVRAHQPRQQFVKGWPAQDGLVGCPVRIRVGRRINGLGCGKVSAGNRSEIQLA